MSSTAIKRAAFPVVIAGGALLLWQVSKEKPAVAESPASSSSPAASSQAGAIAGDSPAAAAESAKPAEMIQATDTTPPSADTPPHATPEAAASNEAPQQPSVSEKTGKLAVAAADAYASPANQANAARVQQDVGSLKFLLRDFRNALGGNPVGSNAEIVRALQGRNQKKLALKLWDGHKLNGEGELVDPWGSPYFFHQLSANEMEIRCAGPDGMMWNKDDIAFP